MSRVVPYETWLYDRLQKPCEAAAYLESHLGHFEDESDDERKQIVASALVNIGKANGIELVWASE